MSKPKVNEDRHWSTSWFCKQWRDDPSDPHGKSLHWEMEVRTEDFGVGSRRMGEIEINGKWTGELTLAIHEQEGK